MTDALVGKRIELLSMPNDPAPLPSGSRGRVRRVTDTSFFEKGSVQIDVEWDDGRSLMLVVPPDRFRVIPEGEET
jgi:hypothetical protein